MRVEISFFYLNSCHFSLLAGLFPQNLYLRFAHISTLNPVFHAHKHNDQAALIKMPTFSTSTQAEPTYIFL